jgi:hypothetical protein
MVRSAPSSNNAINGTIRHAVATAAIAMALVLESSQLTGPWASPSAFMTVVAMPNWELKMNFQYKPVTTGATAQGSRIAMPTIIEPRNALLSSSAQASASGTVRRVDPAASSTVRGMASRKLRSRGIRVR